MAQIQYKILEKKKPYPECNRIIISGGEFDGFEFETTNIGIKTLHQKKEKKDNYIDFSVQYRILLAPRKDFDPDRFDDVVSTICGDFLRKYIESIDDRRSNIGEPI